MAKKKANLNIPPHNTETEEALLGSIMLDKDALVKILDIVSPEDFYDDRNGIIYGAMRDLFNKRSPIDILTLSNTLEEKEQLDTIGGSDRLAEIAASVPTSSHIAQYANITKHKSTLRKLILAGQEITGYGWQEDDDITEVMDKAEQALFKVSQHYLKDNFVHIKDILTGAYDKIRDLQDADEKDKFRGIKTGFHDIDRLLSGLQPADLLILAGRPSMGKTALAINMAQNVATGSQKGTVGVFSLEMSKEQLIERMISSLLGVDSWKLRSGKLENDEFGRMQEVISELSDASIFIDDTADCTVTDIKAKARRLQMEHGLDLLVVDYLQLMSGHNPLNRVQEISGISRGLKAIARELKVPVLALSQLSRQTESRTGHRPMLSDLRDSGSIEQDADVVMMIFREDYYDEDSERKGITDIFIAKHRNGPTGSVELRFNKQQQRFYSVERQREGELIEEGE